MKMLKISIFAITLGIVGALAGAPQANAIEPYDSHMGITDNLQVGNGSIYGITCLPYVDMSLNWSEPLQVSSSWESFEQALDTGSWMVVQQNQASGDVKGIHVYWSEDEQMVATMHNPYGDYVETRLTVSSGKVVEHAYISTDYGGWAGGQDCNIFDNPGYRSDSGDNTFDAVTTTSGGAGETKDIFLAANVIWDVPDYDGELPPEGFEPPVEVDYVPDWYASEADNWVVSLHDQNFNTFDGIEWTCSEDGNSIIEGGDGLAPVLYWQVWRDDFPTEGVNLLIDDGYQSATAPVMVELPINKDEAREYRVAGWYECGGTVDFTDASNFTFVVNKGGVLDETSALSDCISEEFPFIHLDDCISNLAIFGKIALFGGATFNNNWTASTDCTTLNTMDDWLHLENPTVCPMMPSYVRNIVTPFITFILGLITMRFLATRTGKDF